MSLVIASGVVAGVLDLNAKLRPPELTSSAPALGAIARTVSTPIQERLFRLHIDSLCNGKV